MNETPYQILREELIQWISIKTGLFHIDTPTNKEAKVGLFTIINTKGEAISKNREVEYYKILFYKYNERTIVSYKALHNSICELRSKVFNAIAENYESSEAGIIDFDYLEYEYDYEKGVLAILYSFDFERQYYEEVS